MENFRGIKLVATASKDIFFIGTETVRVRSFINGTGGENDEVEAEADWEEEEVIVEAVVRVEEAVVEEEGIDLPKAEAAKNVGEDFDEGNAGFAEARS